jgi:tetratricopeptide (TPR) repeat protein
MVQPRLPENQPQVYAPLRVVMIVFTQRLFGTNPMGYRFFSVMVHLLGVWAVYRLIRILTDNKAAAFWGSLFFAICPVQADAVAPAVVSFQTAGTVLAMWAFYFYIRMSSAAGLVKNQVRHLPLLLAAAAVLTNEKMIVLPALLLMYELTVSSERGDWLKMGKRILPFLIISGVSGVMTLMVKGRAGEELVFLKMPGPALAAVLGTAAAAAWCYWKKKRFAALCLGWALLAALFSSGETTVSVVFARRYFYAVLVPAVCLAAWLGVRGYEKLRRTRGWLGSVFLSVCAALAVVCLVRTAVRNTEFRDELSFYQSAVRLDPGNSLMWMRLGIVYTDAGLFDEALASFEKAAALAPDDPQIYFAMEPAYSAQERYEEGAAALRKVIDLDSDYAEAYFNLAGMTVFLGDEQEGGRLLAQAAEAWQRRGMIMEAAEALEAFYLFMLDRQGLLQEVDPGVFLGGDLKE